MSSLPAPLRALRTVRMRARLAIIHLVAQVALAALGTFAPQAMAVIANPFNAVHAMSTDRYGATSSLLPDGRVLVAGGSGAQGMMAAGEIYDPRANAWTATQAMATARYEHAAVVLANGKVLVAGGTGASGVVAAAELYDPATGNWSGAGTMAAGRRLHTAVLLDSGKVLAAGGVDGAGNVVTSAELYDPATNGWTAAGTITDGRSSPTATLLASGKVMLAGGTSSATQPLASVEFYDPSLNNWSAGNPMNGARREHTATRLPSGKVLVAAGIGADFLNTSELWDPQTGNWTVVASAMVSARSRHAATLLPSGAVLATGGFVAGGNAVSTAEFYDPGLNLWIVAGTLVTPRGVHNATLLPSGKVLISGGWGTNAVGLTAAEIHAPLAGSWSAVNALPQGRYRHTATLLATGQLMIAGGLDAADAPMAGVQLYDPNLNSWSPAQHSLTAARFGHTATLLTSGKVLVAGGVGESGAYLTSAELYDPVSGQWSSAGTLGTARCGHSATLLPSGKVLVAAGETLGTCGNAVAYTATAELYDPATNQWGPAESLARARSQHATTLLADGRVLITGGTCGSCGILLGDAADHNQLYDETSGHWTNAAPMAGWRQSHTASLLPSGKVLVAGGLAAPGGYTTSCELYDPATDQWSPADAMPYARGDHTATLLLTGELVVTGGFDGVRLPTTVRYATEQGLWFYDATLTEARRYHTTTLLPNGTLLVGGGLGASAPSATPYVYKRGFGQTIQRMPTITRIGPPFALGLGARLEGTLFTGDSGASGGSVRDAATAFPLVHLHRLDNGQQAYFGAGPQSPRSAVALRTSALAGMVPGPVAVTVHVNGVASAAQVVTLLPVSAVNLDIDGNTSGNRYSALTDGLLVLRYLFGLTGTSLTNGALDASAVRADPVTVKDYLDGLLPALDIDGNGAADALTDGLLIIRYLFGLRGNALIAGAVGAQATRTTAPAIESQLASLLP